MLRIASIHLREIRLSLKEPFRISSGMAHNRRILLVQLQSADGVSVWGECVAGETPHYSPETLDTVALAIRQWITPLVLDRDFADPRELSRTLDTTIRGHPMAKAAIEMPSWGLVAAAREVPLATLIGGSREYVETGISIPIQDSPENLVQKARAARAEGYRRIKLKIRPGADLEFVTAAREALRDGPPLSVDANSAYTPADFDVLRRLDGVGLSMIEQPLAADDLVRHAALQRELETPICLDESITGPAQAEEMVTLGSGKIINIKPGRVGGFTRAIAIHDYTSRHDIPLWCGGMLESGIGRAYNVALASLPNFILPGDQSPSARYWDRDIVQPEWTMDNGRIRVPLDRSGLGVAVDLDRVENLTVRAEILGGRS